MPKNFSPGLYLRNTLIKGLLLLIPAGTTLLICIKLYDWLNALILVHIHKLFALAGIPRFPLLDILSLLFIILFIGLIGGNFLGRATISLINHLITKVPLIRIVYTAIQQILESILLNDKKAFSKVVLIEYPRKGIYSLGFISTETGELISQPIGEKCYTVFIPTSPNPTSGMMIFVPQKEVIILNMSVNDAAKLVMSGGVVGENSTQLANTPS